jgi:hypothetical protein
MRELASSQRHERANVDRTGRDGRLQSLIMESAVLRGGQTRETEPAVLSRYVSRVRDEVFRKLTGL